MHIGMGLIPLGRGRVTALHWYCQTDIFFTVKKSFLKAKIKGKPEAFNRPVQARTVCTLVTFDQVGRVWVTRITGWRQPHVRDLNDIIWSLALCFVCWSAEYSVMIIHVVR